MKASYDLFIPVLSGETGIARPAVINCKALSTTFSLLVYLLANTENT